MNGEIGTYSFLPWLRQGIANNIQSQDLDETVRSRATVNVPLTLKGEQVSEPGVWRTEPLSIPPVALYGPGDIVGIDAKAIVKNEPRHWITNFEPNYLPYIEFYDEDFPWRYTPATPDYTTNRLRPWIMLVVLSEDEFEEGANLSGKPLPYIKVSNASTVFPPAEELWAWAHVHINEDIVQLEDEVVSSDMEESVLPRFREVLDKNPDLAYSRIMCPRKLDANTAYHAFLIPVFESGRLVSLGLDPGEVPDGVHATFSAWEAYPGDSEKPEPELFPVYHRWYFRTGSVGDFEYLVRLLEPKPIDSRVGRRDMDVNHPGLNIAGISDEELGGILKLGGALKIPDEWIDNADVAEVEKYDNWAEPYPEHDLQQDLARFINLADDYRVNGISEIESDPDPLVTPPLYGRWHAMSRRLLTAEDGEPLEPQRNWVHDLNLDPRWRVAAGFGTRVVQDKQEEYMDEAWGQLGEVLEANRRIRLAQMAREVAAVWHSKHLTPLRQHSAGRALALTAPIQRRILSEGSTVYHHVDRSRVPHAVNSAPMRRMLRPRSRLMRYLKFDGLIQPDTLVERINSQQVHVAPPKVVPDSLPTLDDLADALKPDDVPEFIVDTLSEHPWLQYLPLLLLLILLLLVLFLGLGGMWLAVAAAVAAGLLYLYNWLRKLVRRIRQAESVTEENQTPEAVEELPSSPDFRISEMGSGFKPTQGATDSSEASFFKAALRDTYEFVQLSGQAAAVQPSPPLNLDMVVDATMEGINPHLTIARMVLDTILIPERIIGLIGERFTEAMAYPEIDIPMYRPLVDISADLFLPNINYVSQNSISLLESNQKFIESYMVGLNHEFARELLWREYPTDQRGSYFRQFWDVSSYLDTDGLNDESLKEKLRDIPPLHRWSRYTDLGEHDNRETGGENEAEIVFVVRGELLKKYPTAVIYAHRAKWQLNDDGGIDNTKERELEDRGPPESNVKTPLYEAKVEPDIYFFGFDITPTEAAGGTGENPDDDPDPGWFLVIEERPGEPRFGLDIEREGEDIHVWNDLTWEDVVPGVVPGDFIRISNIPGPIQVHDPRAENNSSLQEKFVQYEEDRHIDLNRETDAAVLAYILYQVPVMVAVHATEMLPKR